LLRAPEAAETAGLDALQTDLATVRQRLDTVEGVLEDNAEAQQDARPLADGQYLVLNRRSGYYHVLRECTDLADPPGRALCH
jgi:hypothetical protein